MVDRIIASSSSEWRTSARAIFETDLPDTLIQPIGEDLLAVSADGLSIADVAEAVTDSPNPFVRHLFREVGRLQVPSRQSLDVTLEEIADVWANLPVPLPPTVSLQVWRADRSISPFVPTRSGASWRRCCARTALRSPGPGRRRCFPSAWSATRFCSA